MIVVYMEGSDLSRLNIERSFGFSADSTESILSLFHLISYFWSESEPFKVSFASFGDKLFWICCVFSLAFGFFAAFAVGLMSIRPLERLTSVEILIRFGFFTAATSFHPELL
jgi:hypothetical protein